MIEQFQKIWDNVKTFLHKYKKEKGKEMTVAGQDVVIECQNGEEHLTMIGSEKKVKVDKIVKEKEVEVLAEMPKKDELKTDFVYSLGVLLDYIESKDKYTNNWARMHGLPLIRNVQLNKNDRRMARYMVKQMIKEIGEKN